MALMSILQVIRAIWERAALCVLLMQRVGKSQYIPFRAFDISFCKFLTSFESIYTYGSSKIKDFTWHGGMIMIT